MEGFIMRVNPVAPCFRPISFDGIRSPLKSLDKCPCAYCGKMLYRERREYTIEHFFKTHKQGGKASLSNTLITCEPCNLYRGSQDLRTFLWKNPDIKANIYRYLDFMDGKIFDGMLYSKVIRDRMIRFRV